MSLSKALLIFLGLAIVINSACSSNCKTCLDPNHYNYRHYCNSCYSNYFVYASTCYHCEYCSSFSMCDLCPISGSGSSIMTYLPIILGVGGGILVLGGILFCVYRRCKNSSESMPERPVAGIALRGIAQISNGRLV